MAINANDLGDALRGGATATPSEGESPTAFRTRVFRAFASAFKDYFEPGGIESIYIPVVPTAAENDIAVFDEHGRIKSSGGSTATPSAHTHAASDINSGTIAVARGGTGTGTAFSSGSVPFAGTGGIHNQDSSTPFKYDSTKKILQVGRVGFTDYGGVAILMVNKTGGASVKGTIVTTSSTTDEGVEAITADTQNPFGIIYENGIADASWVWVVVTGIADVLMVDTNGASRGDVIYVGGTDGRALASSAATIGVTPHWREVGHAIHEEAGGTDVLVKSVIHFN